MTTSARNLLDLENKSVVVTGAGSGIGQGIALGLADLGANVTGFDIRSEYLEETVEMAEDRGSTVETVLCDVSDEEDVVAAFKTVIDRSGHVDVVFANAGIAGPVVPVHDLDLDGWQQTLSVNLTGVFLTAREGYRHMREAGEGGKIILTTSVWGMRGTIDGPFTAYAASKGGVWNLVHQMAIDMAESNVRVNGIAPAGFHTRVADGFYDNQPDAVESLRQQMPSGQIVRPDAMVGPAAFLASSASNHVNGHVLAVDGGYLAK